MVKPAKIIVMFALWRDLMLLLVFRAAVVTFTTRNVWKKDMRSGGLLPEYSLTFVYVLFVKNGSIYLNNASSLPA